MNLFDRWVCANTTKTFQEWSADYARAQEAALSCRLQLDAQIAKEQEEAVARAREWDMVKVQDSHYDWYWLSR